MIRERAGITIRVVAVLCLVAALEIAAITNAWIGAGFFVTAFGSFIYQGLQQIPADPPHVGVLTVLGERTRLVKKEGWRFFPFYPWWHGRILVKVAKVNQDLKEQIVRTPDLAELTIPVSITWTPDKDNAENLIEFLNSGGESGVKTILEDIVRESLREWAFSHDEGPQTWQEAMEARYEAVAMLLKAILGEELTPIRLPFKTASLLRYFTTPRPRPTTKKEKELCGENWENVKSVFEKLSEEERKEIQAAAEERRVAILDARQGNGKFVKPQLGIILNRLNIDEVKPKGELATAAEKLVKEEQERRGEVFEVETDVLNAQQLVDAATKVAGQAITFEEAYRITMEWKTTREGHGFTVPGIAPAVTRLAEAILGRR